MKPEIKLVHGITIMLLILLLPASTNVFMSLSAQSDGSSSGNSGSSDSTSSASQDYQEFQSCLSDAEVDGYVLEQQIRDCFAPIYNTGTTTAGSAPGDTSPSGEDFSGSSTSGQDDAGSSDEGDDSGEETENSSE
jgi:hypothetical protein